MGKTFRRDQQYRPKKQGRAFTKDQSWKRDKKKSNPNIDPNYPDLEKGDTEEPNI